MSCKPFDPRALLQIPDPYSSVLSTTRQVVTITADSNRPEFVHVTFNIVVSLFPLSLRFTNFLWDVFGKDGPSLAALKFTLYYISIFSAGKQVTPIFAYNSPGDRKTVPTSDQLCI